MKKKLVLGILALLAAAGSGIWSVQIPQEEYGSADSRIITDMRGRSVEVPDEIESIIALKAGSLRLLSYFDAHNSVIAVEDAGHGREKSVHSLFYLATYRIAYPHFQDLPSIGSSENHEALIAADPDIIFSTAVDVSELNHLQEVTNIPVFALDADVELNNPRRFFDQIQVLGEVLHEQDRAEELIAGISAILDDLEMRREEVEKPKRAYVGGMMFFGPADLLRTSGDYLPFDLTGTVNVMPTHPSGNLQPYMTSLEQLIEANPQYIFVDAANSELSRSGFKMNRNVFLEHVSAFRNRDVYSTLVYKYYGTNWENQLINIYYAGKKMYPDIYDDIDIYKKAQEIWELFFQVPLEYQQVEKLQAPGFGPVDWY